MGELVEVGLRRVLCGGVGGWWGETKSLMERVGLGRVWWSGDVGSDVEWKKRVREMMALYEESEWMRAMVGNKGKSKLERYVRIKKRLKKEWYLGESRVWVRRWVNMRAGVTKVEEELGRYRGIVRGDRVCKKCKGGMVETIDHVIDECPVWEKERWELWEAVGEIDELSRGRMWGRSRKERVEWLMKGGGGRKMARCVMKKVCRMLFSLEGRWVSKKEGERRKERHVPQESRKRVGGWGVMKGGRRLLCGGGVVSKGGEEGGGGGQSWAPLLNRVSIRSQ